MSKKYENAAEKARLARQAKKSEKNEKRRERRKAVGDAFENFFGFLGGYNPVLGVFVAISILLSAIAFALEIVGLCIVSSFTMVMTKVLFYVSLGLIVASIILICFSVAEESTFGWIAETIILAALIVVGIIILAGGRLAFKNVYTNEQYGVVYVETSTEYQVWKVEEKVEDVWILTEIEGKSVTKIHKNAARGNQKIKTLNFQSGDMEIEKKAFKDCARLKTVNFGSDSEYSISTGAFANCVSLETIDVGDAKIDSLGDRLDGVAFNKATLTIDGGYVFTEARVDTVIVKDNKSSFCSDGYNSSVNPNTVVFANGFDFGDATYISYYNTGFFQNNRHYVSLAETIYLPSSITKIPDYLFGDEGNKCTVHFAGTQEQWESLTIGTNGNSHYTNGKVNVVYNSSYAG